ncbi:hypothetical protein LOTGIDRAFT_60118, partial [Lottia gigantea]
CFNCGISGYNVSSCTIFSKVVSYICGQTGHLTVNIIKQSVRRNACFNCDISGYNVSSCRILSKVVCYICGQIGHKTSYC